MKFLCALTSGFATFAYLNSKEPVFAGLAVFTALMFLQYLFPSPSANGEG